MPNGLSSFVHKGRIADLRTIFLNEHFVFIKQLLAENAHDWQAWPGACRWYCEIHGDSLLR